MKRVINEATADNKRKSNYGVGGGKVGDYGTGGRVYTNIYTQPSSSAAFAAGDGPAKPKGSCDYLTGAFCFLLVAGLLYWTENSYYQHTSCVKELQVEAIALSSPVYDSSSDGHLVHVLSPNPAIVPESSRIVDSFFGIAMPPQHAVGRRVTEYCQWAEHENRARGVVGREPDTCVPNKDVAETNRCSRINCPSDNQCDSECCILTPGADIIQEETSYYYDKAWRPNRINSLLFDNPAAYHNPQRDPAPSTGGRDSSDPISLTTTQPQSLQVQVADVQDALEWWSLVLLDKNAIESYLSDAALQAGFSEADHQYLYSRVPKDGMDNPLVKAAASYLVDGVIDIHSIAQGTGLEDGLLKNAGLDWITKGTCHAGDIRVHFESKALPRRGMSLIGRQVGQQIVPHICSNGKSLLAVQQGLVPLDVFARGMLKDARSGTFWWRLLCGVLLFGIGYFFAVPENELLESVVDRLALGIFLPAISAGVFWWTFYGLEGATIPALGVAVASGGCYGVLTYGRVSARKGKVKDY